MKLSFSYTHLSIILCFLPIIFVSCKDNQTVDSECEDIVYSSPIGFPEIPFPLDNPIKHETVILGQKLFYDKTLSKDGSVSCASCHKQENAFSDAGKSVSRGVANEAGMRNSPTIVNSAYHNSFFYDGRVQQLELQIKEALLSPNEMYSSEAHIVATIQSNNAYKALFYKAFGNDSIDVLRVCKAIACFTRTIVSGDSRYDLYKRGVNINITPIEKQGIELFFSDKTQCASCHSGFNFTDYKFYSTGLYTHYYDKGHYYTTKLEQDIGTFKTPSLRNIALTLPYMHDGSIGSLSELLQHYNHGGKGFINKDKRIDSLHLSNTELQALEAFLLMLTDSSMINNPAYSHP